MGTQGLIKKTERFNNLLDTVPEAYMRTLHMYEYMIVLLPHEELRNKIMQLRKDFAEKFASDQARFLKPHIALARFTTWGMLEEKLQGHLQHIAMGMSPFKVEMKDYGSLPAHTVYIQIPTKLPIMNLVKELRGMQRLMKADPSIDPHFMTEPMLAIGRKLLPWQFEKAWLEYSHRHFTARFIADSMLLLKRRQGEKAYQVLQRLEFQNLPVSAKQGALFV